VKRERNEGGLIARAFFARSPGGSSVMFRYYLLGGDTAPPLCVRKPGQDGWSIIISIASC